LRSYDASIVIPAHEESENIVSCLDSLLNLKDLNLEIFIVVDKPSDSTIPAVKKWNRNPERINVVIQNYGGGPANAIRYGIDLSTSSCVVVTMADGSDDTAVIPDLIKLVNRGVAIACASRYMAGGQQIGGPRFKRFLAKSAGKILYFFAGVGTHDPTNSFKAYSTSFISKVGIESRSGFEIGIELISKARRLRLPIAEVPTVWLDRSHGVSNFRITKWLPQYLKWFFHSFGPTRDY
jgi:dolichol-phosphate mannosyltransferase